MRIISGSIDICQAGTVSFGRVVLFSTWSRPTRRDRCHHPLGDKIRALRKEKKLSLERLAELTESSKSYIWELENKDDPKPSAEKIGKIASVLEVTTEFLLTESTTPPGEEVIDEAFFRKYKSMPEGTKKRLRKILDAWDDDE